MSKMQRFKNPVLVLGGNVSSLWIARLLGRHGIDIYVVVDRDCPYVYNEAAFSKYCKGSFIPPGTRFNQGFLKKLLKSIARKFSRRVVVYPTTDLDSLNLSELKDELPDNYRMVVGNRESVETLVNKKKFYKALASCGIKYPATYYPKDIADARYLGTKMTYPAFIRPAITQLFMRVFGSDKKGFIAYSPKQLTDYYRMASKHGIEVMFQEIIPGPPNNSYQLDGYYNTNNQATILFARQRLRIWPLGFGNSTLCMSIPLEKLAEEKAKVNNFIKEIGYNGLMSAEFKEDTRDRTLKMFEINARVWLHFWLSTFCGADIILSSYLDSVGERANPCEDIRKYKTGIKSIIINHDLRASVYMLVNGGLSFSEWASSLKGVRFDLLSRDDLAPFITSYAKLIHGYMKKIGISKARPAR